MNKTSDSNILSSDVKCHTPIHRTPFFYVRSAAETSTTCHQAEFLMVRGSPYPSCVACFVVTFMIAQCRADPVLDMLCPETLLQSSKCVPKKISTVKKKAINE